MMTVACAGQLFLLYLTRIIITESHENVISAQANENVRVLRPNQSESLAFKALKRA